MEDCRPVLRSHSFQFVGWDPGVLWCPAQRHCLQATTPAALVHAASESLPTPGPLRFVLVPEHRSPAVQPQAKADPTYMIGAFSNPVRRDTVTVPAMSYGLVRSLADIAGLRALHCRAAWHMQGT